MLVSKLIIMNRFPFFIACCFVFLFNCKEATKTTFSDITISTENNNSVEVTIPKASGNDLIVNAINSEIQKVVIYALHVGDPDNVSSKSIEESITSFNKDYADFIKDFPESQQIWEAQIDGELLYESPELTSIAITSYVNTGGAHGTLNISFLNFDSTTGNKITNENIFTNIDAFKKIAQIHFNKAIKEKATHFETDEFELPANIAYTEDGIVLLYNTYEIAPYSTGVIEFAIPFKDVNSYLVFNGAY